MSGHGFRQRWAALSAAVAILLTAGGVAAFSAQADAPVGGADWTPVVDATFTWSLNAETGSGAFFGGCNFLSAGTAGDTGASRVWSEAMGLYRSTDGAVTITKPGPDGTVAPATWANKCRNAAGTTVTTGNNLVSGNRVEISGGSGVADPTTNTARIDWTGSFSVVYYGGMTYWSASDPTLVVNADGTGEVTALASGFGADMDDPEKWTRVEPTVIRLATLTGIRVTAAGIAVTPDYLGVSVSTGDGLPQSAATTANAAFRGSFPQSFVDFQFRTGQAAYWYTSGGQRDPAKSTSPLAVGFSVTPTATEPTATEPTATEPTATEPTASEPTDPTGVTEPPVITDPTGTTTPVTVTTTVTAPTTVTAATTVTAPTTVTESSPGTVTGGKRAATGATLTWAINEESSSAAFFGGCNFLIAGIAPNAGSSRIWRESDNYYATSSGSVTVEKPDSSGAFTPPTWATKCKDADGATVTTGNDRHTGSRVRYIDGTGWSDPSANQAQISWKGAFTVVYYGGMSYWQAADPMLTVNKDGSAVLTATGSGYGADMDDPSVWTRVAPRTIELARMTGVTVTPTGFTHRPEYLGVAVGVAANGPSVPQVPPTSANQSYWGSFPQSFVDFQVDTGQAAYWYTSGGQRDPAKIAQPVIVGYTLGDLVDAPDPTTPAITTVTVGPSTTTATATLTRTAAPTTTGGAAGPLPDAPFEVDDAVLRWGLTSEANNRAFAPGTVNMFSAGRLPSAGPAQQITPARWQATAGDVRIEKRQPDGTYSLATFDGLSTTADGTALGAPSAGTFSDHQVVIGAGAGTVDPAANTATIRWTGDFTVAFYSGLTFFYVTDPVLTVEPDGTAQLTATLGGYGSDMNDATKWEKLDDRPDVVLADLSGVRVDDAPGFTATPAYAGVTYSATGDGPGQRADSPYFGAFPQSFVDYQRLTGQAAYWYSSGGATDRFKVALPLTVSYSGSDPVPAGPVVGGSPSAAASTAPTPNNAVRTPPSRSISSTGRSTPAGPVPEVMAPPTATPVNAASAAVVEAPAGNAAPGQALAPAPVYGGAPMMLVAQIAPVAAVQASATPTARTDEMVLWAGGGLALGLALLVGLYGTGFRVGRKH